MTAHQRRILEALAAGDALVRHHDMGWFQKGGWSLRSDRKGIRAATVAAIKAYIAPTSKELGTSYTDYGLSAEGRRVLGEKA